MADGSIDHDGVLFERLPTASGQVFGRATLDSPGNLNALTQRMVDRLGDQFEAWSSDPEVVGVILDSASDKAFCAGGDVVALHHSARSANGAVPAAAATFFEHEYRLDHRIHMYPKPLLCWGHGIVMGGGVGLFVGASHRVVTPRTRFAMPEITIGLYPDVGGSWVLARLRARTGLFLALTGASLNAADLRHAGLADYVVDPEGREAAYRMIADATWSGDGELDRAALSHLLDRLPTPTMAASNLQAHGEAIDRAMGNDTLADVAVRLAALADDADPWLAAAAKSFVHGIADVGRARLRIAARARHASLADAFRLEYQASVGCTMAHDFAEGVRALLVDKDKSPRWSPAMLADVSPAAVAAHLQPRFAGAHPLADLH